MLYLREDFRDRLARRCLCSPRLDTLDDVVQCLVERLRAHLMFVRRMRMLHGEQRRVRLDGDARDNVRIVAHVHDVLPHELVERLRLRERTGRRIVQMIVKVWVGRGERRVRRRVALLVDERRRDRDGR